MAKLSGGNFTLILLFSILLRSKAFVLNNASIKCLPRSPSACHCGSFTSYQQSKEIKAANIYCDETSPFVFPDFSLISKSLINSEEWYIGLTRNNLTNIPGGAFIGFIPTNFNTTYLYLDLNENYISKIENNAFIGVENMYLEMDLSKNNLTYIPLALLILNQLNGISLQFNPIKTIDPIVLQHLAPMLGYIDIGIGNLASWPAELSSFTNLFHIGLFNVKQFILPRHPFNGSENNIAGIIVGKSDLNMIPCSLTDLGIIHSLTIHDSPNLSATNLIEVCRPNYTMSSTVEKVHLVNGALTEFPNILKYTPMLRMLNLYGNKIQYVNEEFIPINNRLLDLMLSYNHLQTIPNSFLRFKNLRTLMLDNNNIATFTPALANKLLHPYSILCLRDNPVDTTNLTVKCTESRDSWARD